MNLLEQNAMITLAPGFGPTPEKYSNFRWNMHISLPYPFPSRTCVSQSIEIAGKAFSFGVHNHFRRIIQSVRDGDSGPVFFQVHLEDKHKPQMLKAGEADFTREDLQSVVIFEDQSDYASPNEAFASAETKIKACLEWLESFLSACQRAAPYLTAWLVYPISMFDVGTAYHNVTAYRDEDKRWCPFASAAAISIGRQLQRPTFVIDVPTTVAADSPIDIANELLAEASMSLVRGMTRLTVLNAYTAVESLANAVFLKTKIAMLVGHNVPETIAEQMVDGERKQHRTNSSFLYHNGMKAASGRSLCEENQPLYQELNKIQDMRHKVAHTGYRPTKDEARRVFVSCCESVQWLADVGGFIVKPLRPDASATLPGFSAAFKDAQARGGYELEMIRQLLSLGPMPSREGE